MRGIPSKPEFGRIRNVTNDACNTVAQKFKDTKDWAVNWGSLCCDEVLFCVDENGHGFWLVHIEEVSHDTFAFAEEIRLELGVVGVHNVRVDLDW